MAITVLTEGPFGLKVAARQCPGRDGGPTHWQTLRRWAKKGRTAAYAAGDTFTVVVTPNHTTGTLPQGVYVSLVLREAAD